MQLFLLSLNAHAPSSSWDTKLITKLEMESSLIWIA